MAEVETDGTEGPSVGNVLGFSLLFRERKALLALGRRGLAPGVRVRDYEAEIPNIAFPLKGALQATRFRHRRCRAVAATLVVETRALAPWIERRLAGRRLARLRIDDVEVDLRASVPGARTPRPVLGVGGRAPDGSRFWFQTALRIEPDGRHLRLRPTHQWLFGDLSIDESTIWREILSALRDGCTPQIDGSVLVDVARLALTGPFVRTGWKAPDLSALGIETVALGRRSITVEFRTSDGEEAVPVDPEVNDPVGDTLARVHAHRGEPSALEDRVDLIRQAAARLEPGARARLACATWAVQLTRYHDRAACLVALREWLDVRPSDRAGRRLLATTLGRAGYDQELARLLVADRRRASSPRHAAQLDLALATLLVERLDEARSALALLRPLVHTLREDQGDLGRDLLPGALVVLAQARVVDAATAGARAGHAQQALDEAIVLVDARPDAADRPWRRADMRAAVARTFARHGELAPALSLMGRALADDPGNDEHLDLAIELSLGLGDRPSAVDLLRVRLEAAPRGERAELRRRLLGVLSQMEDPEYLTVTREEVERALELEPDDVEVLTLAARVERRADHPALAAEYLARLAELEPDPDRRLDFELERASLLDRARFHDAAWDAARSALALVRELDLREDSRVVPTIELALELAPPTARGELLDTYIHHARGEGLGRALLERADGQIAHADKIADLEAAARELSDPAPVFTRIENLAGHDVAALLSLVELAESREAWPACASALARLAQVADTDHRFGDARRLYARALGLCSDRLDWRLRLASSLERHGEVGGAIEQLEVVLDAWTDHPEPPDVQLEGLGEGRPALHRKVAALAAGGGDDERALRHLESARDSLDPVAHEIDLEATCDELFAVLYRLGRTEAAEDLAARMLGSSREARRPHWLVNAAIVSSGDARLARLREAAAAAPDEPDVADALESELRARGLGDELEAHLRERLQRAGSPTERAEVLERLIATIDVGGHDSPGFDELAELHAELLTLRPEHVDTLVALAELRQLSGAEQEALMLWRRAAGLLAEDDPRMFAPALRLGRQALRDDLLDDAERWFRHAVALRPDDHDALLGLHEVGSVRGDPRLILDAADGLLSRTEQRTRRAELELECARAHIELEEGALAFDRLKRSAAETEPRSALHLEIAETWLDLARKRGIVQEEGLARGQLRRALGADLPSEALHEEIRLLADELDAIDAALELVELALVRHGAARTTLALLERLTDGASMGPRRLEILRAVIDQLDDPGARDRTATTMLGSARTGEDPALALLALDRMSPGAAERPEHLEVRRWAIASLGRVEEERAEIEARLSDPTTPLSSSLLTRFRDCFGDADDPSASTAAAARLVELAAAANPERGARLAEQAFGLVEARPSPGVNGEATLSAESGLAALAVLAPRGEVARARWQRVEDEVFVEGRADRIARLSELAAAAHLAGVEHLAGRARELLERGLERAPGAAPLHARLRASLAPSTGDDPTAFLEGLRTRLDAVARRRGLADEARAELFIASAQALDGDAAVEHLRARALIERGAPSVFERLVEELERRRAWSHVVELRATEPQSPSAEAWVSLALRARKDAPRAEMIARTHAGRQLLDTGQVDAAIEHLRRALEIDPEQPALARDLGQALASAGRPAEALERLGPLAEAGPSATAGTIDFPALYLQCGRLALDLDRPEQAADWLVRARRRAPDRPELRRDAAGALFDVLAALGRRREASRLAEATAEEHFTDLDAAAAWLRRAVDQLADGTDPSERRRLLTRLRDLDPDDAATLDDLEVALDQAGDEQALVELLRQRLAELDLGDPTLVLDAAALRRVTRLEASLSTLGLDPTSAAARGVDVDRARVSERLVLLDVLARHADDPIPTRLTMAQLEAASGKPERAARRRRELIQHAPEDPRVGPAVLGVLSWATAQGEHELAGEMARRAHALGLRDLATLATTRRLGRELSDPELLRIGASGLLEAGEMPEGEVAPEPGRLALDLAEALADLAQPTAALEAFERGAAEAPPGGGVQRELVDRWMALLETSSDMVDPGMRAQSEAKARAHVRRLSGDALPRADRLAEIDLLLETLGRVEPAIGLAVDALAAAPEDDEIRRRLRRACARSEATDRYPRALRDVLDRLATDTSVDARDGLLMELARAAHEMEGARTTLRAVDELGETAAAAPEMLDLRDWAVRKLGRVEDELEAIEGRLVTAPADALAVTRLWRTLESDAERTARRLLELRGRPEVAPTVAHWLALRSLEILVDRSPAEPDAWIDPWADAFEAALDDGQRDETLLARDELREAWLNAARQVGDDPGVVARLGALARRLGASALDAPRAARIRSALQTVPDDPRLHQELLDGADDLAGAAAWLQRGPEASEDGEDLPPPSPVLVDRQLVGLAKLTDAATATVVLARRLEARPPATSDDLEHNPVLEHLYELGAWSTVAGWLRSHAPSGPTVAPDRALDPPLETWTAAWHRLARASDPAQEVSTTSGADDRGRGHAEVSREAYLWVARHCTDAPAALAAYERALALGDDANVRLEFVGRLEEFGDRRGALATLDPLAAGDPVLARRAGDLAAALDETDAAIEHWRVALFGVDASNDGGTVGVSDDRDALAVRAFEALVERERAGEAAEVAMRMADEAVGDADVARWLSATARLPKPELAARGLARTELLGRALARDPGRPGLPEAYETALEDAGDLDGLREALATSLSQGQGSPDPAQRDRRLTRWLELVADSDTQERHRALEVAARHWPEDLDTLLELAEVRDARGDRPGALELWSNLADVVGDVPRFYGPAVALAEVAAERGDLDASQRAWTRALACDPEAVEPWRALRTLAVRRDDPQLTLDSTRALLDARTRGRLQLDADATLELRREEASALDRLGRSREAAEALGAAVALAPPGSRIAVSICERWLELISNLEADAELDERQLAHLEARARAALREALGDDLPAAALRAEARLLATRLDAPDEALLLVRERVLSAPDHLPTLDVLADLTDELGRSEPTITYLGELERLVDEAPTGRPKRRLREHLALAARERSEPEVALRAVDGLGPAAAETARMVEVRAWAVRRTGRTDQEIARLVRQIRELAVDEDGDEHGENAIPLAARLEPLSARVLDLYEGDAQGWARQLVGAARARADAGGHHIAVLVCRHAEQHGGVAVDVRLDAVDVALRHGPLEDVAGALDTLFRDLLDEQGPDNIRRALVDLDRHELTAADADATRDAAGQIGRQVDRLVEALWGHAPGDAVAHRIARARIGGPDQPDADDDYARRVQAFADAQSVSGAALGQLWVGAARSAPQDRVVPHLEAALTRTLDDDPACMTILRALESLGAWASAVRGWLTHPRLGTREDLERLLDATAGMGELQAVLAQRLAADIEGDDAAFAAKLYALALEHLDPEAAESAHVRRRLGLTLAEAGRAEAALEHLLPLVELVESPGSEQERPSPDLMLRVADLLLEGGRADRALPLVEAAWRHPELSESARADLSQRLWTLAERAKDEGSGLPLDAQVHAEAYTLAAQRSEGKSRVAWLRRAGELSDPRRRVALLKQAVRLAPDDTDLHEAFVRALADAGETRELEAVLRRRLDRDLVARSTAEDVDAATRRAVGTAKQLLGIVRPTKRVGEAVALHEIILRLDSAHVESWLDLAELRMEAGDRRGAEAAWAKIAELTPQDDDRSFEPVMALAEAAAKRGDDEVALQMLERALAIRPGDRGAWIRRLEYGERFERPDVVLAASETLLGFLDADGDPADTDDRLDLADLERARATAFDHLGDPQAHRAWARAVAAAHVGDDEQEAIAHAWIESAGRRRHEDDGARLEAEARRALREAVSARDEIDDTLVTAVLADVEAEVELLASVLDAPEEALEVVEFWLAHVPAHRRLLELVKELSLPVDGGMSHVGALERALQHEADPVAHDALAAELAYASVELVDPERLLAALDQLSGDRAAAAEMLDLREWAVRQLGRVDDELLALEQALAGDDPIDATVARLLRMLDGDPLRTARRVLEVARKHGGPRRAGLLDHVLELAISAEPAAASAQGDGSDVDASTGAALDLALETLAFGVREEPAFDPMRSLEVLERAAFEADDPGRLANLVAATLSETEVADGALARRGEELLGLGLLRYPDEAPLHRAVLRLAGAQDNLDTTPLSAEVVAAAAERLAAVATASSVRGYTAARMWTGFAHRLDRPQAAKLLAHRAELALSDDPDAFSGLLEALQDRKHWPDVMRLLELRMSSSDLPEHKVEALKQLAHIRADILGDQATAIRQLEAALEFAPRDPDLLLPLLDHHFGQRDLGPAIELSVRVLEHVPMGDMAFTALGHRAADAALARGEHGRAESLLERVLERTPDDERTEQRLAELRAMAHDAEHRVRMLAAIANRQSGSARADALEERARLLAGELDRPDDAISDLEAVHDEAPERRDAVQLLDDLYVRRERWSDLVTLLEHDYPRHAGRARAEVLERVAGLYSERLFDLGQAERALRLALEQLGQPVPESDERTLSDRLHLQMTRCLELQGRYEELAALLEDELKVELDQEQGLAPSASRVELMAQLARVVRDYVEDEARAARVYERLERMGELPEEGLATLARWYRAQHRHEDLVRVLIVRAKALGREGDIERKAELDRRIGELLDGPLRRPHEAAHYFLDAYLANPEDNFVAGNRARVLLAGTDSVVRVRQAILERLPDLDDRQRAFGLVLLAELLAPQESFETEAEHRFEEALDIVSHLGPAHDGLGRLRARQGRLEEAVGPLVAAATSEGLEPERAADTAAVAARALLELHRAQEAEAVLKSALARHPSGQRALLELARLYSRTGRRDDEASALDELSSLSLSSMLRAEVAYRRAMLLEPEFTRDPFCEAGEEARAFLLEAVGADAMHAQARQVLLDLASARSEWSIVAHMYFLTVRELPPGPSRALNHLDLASVYLDKLHDAESATRNLASALSQPTTDLVVRKRANNVAVKLPNPDRAAGYLARHAAEDDEIDDNARARLLVSAAELHLRGDDPEAGERALARARALPEVSEATRDSIDRVAELLGAEDFELKKERTALLRLLEGEDHAVERLHILSRLCEIARAVDDGPLLESSSRQLIEAAHGMLANPAERESAVVALRDLFAERGDFGRLVALYEELAKNTQDASQAADMLVDAARFAWTGVRDGKLAVAILGRALRRQPTHPLAIALLGDMAAAEDLPTETAILDELSRLDAAQLDPRLVLRLAAIATRLGRSDRTRQMLSTLLSRRLAPAVELDTLAALDRVLQDRGGEVDARLDTLARRLALARQAAPDQVDGLATELARAQMAAGAFDAARRTCTEALEAHPQNAPLAVLYAELLERNEDWPTLARLLEHLGSISIAADDKARWLTRAARVHLDHDEVPREAMSSARRLLIRAREMGPRYAEARSTMIPLSFAEQRWDEVLELSIELRSVRGDGDEALLFGAITEALVHGRRTIARSIGARHPAALRAKLLWPAVARVCEHLAQHGPLPRLDAVLGATAALTGTTEEVRDELSAWTAGRAPRAGTTLALARANEALGRRAQSHLQYQLAAFLAPSGPVSGLVERLPELPPPSGDPLHDAKCVPLAWRSALRELLIALRELLAGIRGQGGEESYPKNAIERAAVQTAGRFVANFREPLGMTIPVRLTDDPLYAGVGIRNRGEPMVVVSEELTSLPDAERAFRLAMATAAIASGLAMVTDTHPLGLGDLLDAIARIADPDQVLESSGARYMADALAARGLRASEFDAELRATLAAELKHWRRDDRALDQLVTTIRRATMLMATRLSGRLDGALLTLARDQGVLVEGEFEDGRRILTHDDAQWLLRELGLQS